MADIGTTPSTERSWPRGRSWRVAVSVNYWVDLLAFSSGILVFGTGIVLLTQFHVGEGALCTSGFGLSRLLWTNIHRLSAVACFAAVVAHGVLRRRPLLVRLGRALKRLPGKASRADLVLYFGFVAVAVTASIAWFAVQGSTPLLGPVRLTHLEPVRHHWIDLHNLSALILFPAAIIHVRRHLPWMFRVGKQQILTQATRKP